MSCGVLLVYLYNLYSLALSLLMLLVYQKDITLGKAACHRLGDSLYPNFGNNFGVYCRRKERMTVKKIMTPLSIIFSIPYRDGIGYAMLW